MTWTVGFYIVPMIDNVAICAPYCVFAGLTVFFFPLTIGVLLWRGPAIRENGPQYRWD